MDPMTTLILDNPVFNVKGQGRNMLHAALSLAKQCVGKTSLSGYRIDTQRGVVLYWTDSEHPDYQKFITPSQPDDIVDMLHNALSSISINPVPEAQQDDDIDEDPHFDRNIEDEDDDIQCEPGWRLFTEEWGHIHHEWQACLALIPSYLWIGK